MDLKAFVSFPLLFLECKILHAALCRTCIKWPIAEELSIAVKPEVLYLMILKDFYKNRFHRYHSEAVA